MHFFIPCNVPHLGIDALFNSDILPTVKRESSFRKMSGYIDLHDVVGADEARKLFDKLSTGHLERIGAIPITGD
jgi:hypothetical protein